MEEAKRKLAEAEAHLEASEHRYESLRKTLLARFRILSSVMFVCAALGVSAGILGFRVAQQTKDDLVTTRQALTNTNFAVCVNTESAFTGVTSRIPGENAVDFRLRILNLQHRLQAAGLFPCESFGFPGFDQRRKKKLREVNAILLPMPKKPKRKEKPVTPVPSGSSYTPPSYVPPSTPSPPDSNGGHKKKGNSGMNQRPPTATPAPSTPAPTPPPTGCAVVDVLGICI